MFTDFLAYCNRNFDQGQPRIVLSTDKPETCYLESFHATRSPKQAPLQTRIPQHRVVPVMYITMKCRPFRHHRILPSLMVLVSNYSSLSQRNSRAARHQITACYFLVAGWPINHSSGLWSCTSACNCYSVSRCGELSHIYVGLIKT